MMGPLLEYRDGEHLDRLLLAARAVTIDVYPDGAARRPAFWFRRGRGLVHGSCWDTKVPAPMIYFSFGHTFNPFLWTCDGRLLSEIEQVFIMHGSRRIAPEELE